MDLTALLRNHMVARRAIRRLEMLCERFPDPALRDAIETLRREEHKESWQADVPHGADGRRSEPRQA